MVLDALREGHPGDVAWQSYLGIVLYWGSLRSEPSSWFCYSAESSSLCHTQLVALVFLGVWKEESKLALANPGSASCPCGCDVCPTQPQDSQSVCFLASGLPEFYFFVLFQNVVITDLQG
jgi:hypothetical protein